MTGPALLALAASLSQAAPARRLRHPAASVSLSTAPVRLSTEDRRRALLLADLLIEDGRLAEAERLVRNRLAAEPGARDWEMRLANVEAAEQRHAEARAELAKLLLTQPDDPGLLLQYGEQSEAAGYPEDARSAYHKAQRLSRDPRAPYYLSELAFSRGDAAAGRRWAREGLSRLKSPKTPEERRMALRLKSRLGWSDALNDEYGRLYDDFPGEPDTLAEWADALLRAGLPQAAREPVELLRERFPEPQARWRLLEAERLAAAGDRQAQLSFLEDSVRALPGQASLRMELGYLQYDRRNWGAAEDEFAAASATQAYLHPATAMWIESIRQGHHYAGPYMTWRQSVGARALELGASYAGYPRPRWRLESRASRARYLRYSTGQRETLSGGAASLAYEAPRWTLGGDLDLRAGFGRTFLSPGVLGTWTPVETLSLSAQADAGRAWTDSAEAAVAGARADDLQGSAYFQALPRVSLGGTAVYNRLSLPGGGRAAQTQLEPEADYTLLSRPFSASLAYRFVSVDASGDDGFFAVLPLLRRSRTHYLVLSAGERWLDGRLRADGYIFNGHDPALGFKFGTSALVGYGARVEWLVARLRLTAAYDHTKEDELGVGGHSDALRLWAQWRWAPGRSSGTP